MEKLERIFFINRELKKFGKVSLKKVAGSLNVEEEKVEKDIKYMNEKLNAKIKFSEKQNSYYYSENFKFEDDVDEKWLLFYSFVKSIASNHCYLPVVTEEIINELSKFVRNDYNDLTTMITYELSGYDKINNDFLKTILESKINSKQLKIDYLNIKNENTQRYVEAEKIMNYNGKWYLLAYCHKSKELRVFSMPRINYVEITNMPIKKNISDNILNEFISKNFGIFKNKKSEIAVIKFSGKAARIIKDQIWHKDQEIEFIDEESILLKLPIANHIEILGNILHYGSDAEVIEPQKLKNKWIAEIKKMFEKIQR